MPCLYSIFKRSEPSFGESSALPAAQTGMWKFDSVSGVAGGWGKRRTGLSDEALIEVTIAKYAQNEELSFSYAVYAHSS